LSKKLRRRSFFEAVALCCSLYELFFRVFGKKDISFSFRNVISNQHFFLIINGVVAFYARKRSNAPSVVVVLLFFETRERERERVFFFSVVRFVISDLVIIGPQQAWWIITEI